jgi:hypothetical protein
LLGPPPYCQHPCYLQYLQAKKGDQEPGLNRKTPARSVGNWIADSEYYGCVLFEACSIKQLAGDSHEQSSITPRR